MLSADLMPRAFNLHKTVCTYHFKQSLLCYVVTVGVKHYKLRNPSIPPFFSVTQNDNKDLDIS